MFMWYTMSQYSTDWCIEVEGRKLDGTTYIGVPSPFWCGSDCPCSTLEDWRNGEAACGTDYCTPKCWKIGDIENIYEWRFINGENPHIYFGTGIQSMFSTTGEIFKLKPNGVNNVE